MVASIIKCSEGKASITIDEEIYKAMWDLRQFMFDKVYLTSASKGEEDKASVVIRQLYYYFIENPLQMPKEF
jgi:dGTPase